MPRSGAEGAEGAPRRTAGDLLRQAREARGLSIDDLTGELRIERKHLLALEENRFHAIGAPVFARGYLRHYGQRLGLDISELLAAYDAQVQGQQVDLRPKHPIRLRDDQQIGTGILAVGALVVVGGVLAYWTMGWQPAGPDPSVASPAAGPAAGPAPDESPLSAPDDPAAVAVGLPDMNSAAAAGAGAAAETPTVPFGTVPAESPVPVEPGPALPEAPPFDPGAIPDDGTAAMDVPADAGGSAPPAGSGGALRIELRFVEDCWVEIEDSAAQRLYYGLGRAGTRAEVNGNPPVEVLLGNADAVSMLVDGAPFTIPRTPRQGNRALFTVSASE